MVGYSWESGPYVATSRFTSVVVITNTCRLLPTVISQTALPTNTFQVPDYDDDEGEEDDDISFVQETVLKPKLELFASSSSGTRRGPVHHYTEDATSGVPGQGVIDFTQLTPQQTPPSLVSSHLPPMKSTPELLSPTGPTSVATSGPSGVIEAERKADKAAINSNGLTTSSTGNLLVTELHLPAKGNGGLPATSPSKEPDLYVVENPKLGLSGQKKRVIVIDDDLTQSESDPDEASSPDLMVDDSEDGQGFEIPTDYGSDSGDEALLMAEDRGTALSRMVELSTDSEDSRSEVSDDIGLDQGVDFFDHSDSKLRGTEVHEHNEASDHSSKAADEPEPVPYNMKPGNFTMPCSRLVVAAKPVNRAPSPSDAALAKPCEIPSGNAGFQGGFYSCTIPQPWSNSTPSPYNPAWPCTFDGRPNSAYDERFAALNHAYNSGYGLEQVSSESFRAFPSPAPVGPDHDLVRDHSSMEQHEAPIDGQKAQKQSQAQSAAYSNTIDLASMRAARLAQDAHPSAAKVSIDSIVEPTERAPAYQVAMLKRKADDMTSVKIAETTAAVTKSGNTTCPQTKTVTAAQIKAIQDMPSVSDHEGERPAKRARTGKETGKSSFATLAATALAGAVVGGVGVVAALVALPPDFFV